MVHVNDCMNYVNFLLNPCLLHKNDGRVGSASSPSPKHLSPAKFMNKPSSPTERNPHHPVVAAIRLRQT